MEERKTLNGYTYCEDCLSPVSVLNECLCLVERVESNWHNEVLREEGWFEVSAFDGFKILGGSESFEAAVEDLSEEEKWMEEAEDIPVSAEEVVQKIRLQLGTRAPGGGDGCGRTDRPCCGGSCR